MPEVQEKINLKNLYEMFRYTTSHGLVFLQFLGVLSIFFVARTRESKNTITELYKNLPYATLSGANDFNFDAVSGLRSSLSFSIKNNTLAGAQLGGGRGNEGRPPLSFFENQKKCLFS